MHELDIYAFELPTIEDFLSGDSRTLAFQVVDGDGTGVGITAATVTWGLFEREYQTESADAILTESDGDVTVVTSGSVDPTVGEFKVQLSPAASEDLWGEYYHRPKVEQADGSVAKWRGELVLTA